MSLFRSIIAALLLTTILALPTQADITITIKTGDIIRNEKTNHTYVVGRALGAGLYGQVFDVVDEKNQTRALKVTSNSDKYKVAGEREIKILKFIQESKSPNPGKKICVEMVDHFVYENQICMVFEKLGMAVRSYIRKNKRKPLSMNQIKLISWQLFQAVNFLHEIGIMHADIKPNNFLFVNSSFDNTKANESKKFAVKLIDFGFAKAKGDSGPRTTNMRNNRPPEMITGLGWSFPSDVWALACSLFQLYSGAHRLFKIEHNDRGSVAKHLLMIETVLQNPANENELVIPKYMQSRAKKLREENANLFTKDGRVNYDCSKIKNFHRIYKPLDKYKVLKNDTDTDHLFDLMRKMLTVDPKKRIKMPQALEHPFFDRIDQIASQK